MYNQKNCASFLLKNFNKITVIVHFNYFWNFRVFLARQPQGVLLDRVPPFKPCGNAFFLSCCVSRSRQGRAKF
jgi:hypothetical protein